jgi:hypothetical protein
MREKDLRDALEGLCKAIKETGLGPHDSAVEILEHLKIWGIVVVDESKKTIIRRAIRKVH